MSEQIISNTQGRTIDLRAPQVSGNLAAMPTKQKTEFLEWSAPEYKEKERGPYWFFAPGTIALALTVFGVLTKSYFFAVFIVLAFLVLAMYKKKTPRTIFFALTGESVQAGNKIYPFSNIKSFWIFDLEDGRELSLEIKSALLPFIRLPLGSMDSDKIRPFLLHFVPEEEHKELASEKIARSLGL